MKTFSLPTSLKQLEDLQEEWDKIPLETIQNMSLFEQGLWLY
jgi:hypothetical protein